MNETLFGSLAPGPDLKPEPQFRDTVLRGDLARQAAIKSNLEYLKRIESLLQKAGGSYATLLSGESAVSEKPVGQLTVPCKRTFSELGLLDKTYMTFGGALLGPDYEELTTKNPLSRYKFYSSFNLGSIDAVVIAQDWLKDIVSGANQLRISLTAKTFDHAYDSLNLYTWHPDELAIIIQKLYPKYAKLGLYNSTPHLFQGQLDGINADHVGFVQEPINGWPEGTGNSHSSRMRILGNELDHLAGGLITTDNFIAASLSAGVKPERPYLIAA